MNVIPGSNEGGLHTGIHGKRVFIKGFLRRWSFYKGSSEGGLYRGIPLKGVFIQGFY